MMQLGGRVILVRPLPFCLAIAVILGGCRPRTGTLELRFDLPAGATAGLRAVEFTPEWGGANPGPERDAGWRRVPLAVRSVSLPALDDPVTVAVGALPAGRYHRVFVAAPTVTGVLTDGTRLALESHIEPIARGFDLTAGGHITVDIELIVLPRAASSGGGRQIFVKDATLADPASR